MLAQNKHSCNFLFVARDGLCCWFCDFAVSFLVPPDGPKNGTVNIYFLLPFYSAAHALGPCLGSFLFFFALFALLWFLLFVVCVLVVVFVAVLVFLFWVAWHRLWTDTGLCKGPCSLLILPMRRLSMFLHNSLMQRRTCATTWRKPRRRRTEKKNVFFAAGSSAIFGVQAKVCGLWRPEGQRYFSCDHAKQSSGSRFWPSAQRFMSEPWIFVIFRYRVCLKLKTFQKHLPGETERPTFKAKITL